MTYTNKEAQDIILKGFNLVANAVKLSLGAEGSYGFTEDSNGVFFPTKDGYKLGKYVYAKRKSEQIGCNIAKQLQYRQMKSSGDNTTTVLVLAQTILNSGMELIRTKNLSAVDFRAGLKKASQEAQKAVKKLSKVATEDDILSIARVSANNDPEIARIISEIYQKLGAKSLVNIEKTSQEKTTVKYSEGLTIERGYKSPLFCNTEKMTVEFESPYVLLFEGQIQNLQMFKEVVEKIAGEKKPLVLIADAISEDALDILIDNSQRGAFEVVFVQSPDYGDKKKLLSSDIAVFTDGEVFVQGVSADFKLGKADKVVVDSEFTTFIAEQSDAVKERIAFLQTSLENATDPEFTQQRIAGLSGKTATIYVGSKNPSETDEIADRIEDAKCAVVSASEGGFCAGGGVTYLHISGQLRSKMKNDSEQQGYNCFREALKSPFKQILVNGDKDPAEIEPNLKKYGQGYDVSSKKFVDMFDCKIIDSSKSLISAIEEATSTCDLILNTKILTVVGQ